MSVPFFQRTKPVPRGHCPEPVVEVELFKRHGRMRAKTWYRSDNSVTWYADCGSGVCILDCIHFVEEYGNKIMDDAADLRLPWRVAPLDGKYYGTHVLDADGEEVIEFWDHSVASHPSVREKAAFGDDWTEEAWADYCCDSHWESERDYVRACAVVDAINVKAGIQ